MQFQKGYIYHIFNQGNNRQKIFFERENYLFFLKKIKAHILPYCDILAWCLMPNHFHLMVLVNRVNLSSGGATSSRTPTNTTLNASIGIMLASYTRAIHKQQNISGSLFRKNTKAECINCNQNITPSFIETKQGTKLIIPYNEYPQVCFDYIHKNPVKAKLVKKPETWEFSSAKDYAGLRKGKLVNKVVASQFVYF